MAMVTTFAIHALCARTCVVLAWVACCQLIKSFLLAGVEAAVETARGLIALFGFGGAFLGQLLRQIEPLGCCQLAQIGSLAMGLGARLRGDCLGIFVPGCLLVRLDLQKCFHALCAFCMKLGKVGCRVAWTVLDCGMGRGRYGRLCSLGVGAEGKRACQGSSGDSGGQSTLEAFHHKFLSSGVAVRQAFAVSLNASLRALCKAQVMLCCCCVK